MKRIYFFHLDNTLNTYILPILKIVSCVAIILLLIFRNRFIHVEQPNWKLIVGGASVIVGYVCIMCVYISLAEILVVYEKRLENQKSKNKECKWFPVDKVVSLASQNDIIEIQIVSGSSCIKVGSSSNLKPGDSVFFDKRYYIGNQEFEKSDQFHEELLKYSDDEEIPVITIDGVSPECFL